MADTPKSDQPRKMPRVSKAKGRMRPGFDEDKLAAQAQEMDDLEYIQRLKQGFQSVPPPAGPKPKL